MIRSLLRVLGADHTRQIKVTMVIMAMAAVAEGGAYAFLLPVLARLLGPTPTDAWPWLGGFAAAVVICAALRCCADLLGFHSATALLRSMYRRVGDHLARLPVGWFSAQRTGELSVLASGGILDALGAIAHLLLPYLSASLTPLTIVVVILSIDGPLGLVAVGAAPVVFCTVRWTKRWMASLDAHRRRQEYRAADRVVEFLRAQPLLRASGRGGHQLAALESSLRAMRRTAGRLLAVVVPTALGASAIVQVAFTAVLVLGAARAVQGALTVGELLVVLILAARCVDPILALAGMSADVRSTEGTLAEVEEVLAVRPLPEPAQPASPGGTSIELDAVRWQADGRTVIDGVTLQVADGQRLAVVGPSGAGKSTLLHLVARFYDVDAGAVRIGGTDVRSMTAEELSEQIAFVFQDTFLLDTTIEENIRLGQPEAADEQVRRAATAARLDEVAARLPHGWASKVGEGGSLLSGGERQRVAIARALLKDAPIVLLDEVTAALDPINEAAINAGLEALTKGRTTVVVAHRLHTIRQDDRILVLDRGRVVEAGTHPELMVLAGRYAELVQAGAVDDTSHRSTTKHTAVPVGQRAPR